MLRLLVRMTLNKARGAAKREGCQRRDYRREQAMFAGEPDAGEDEAWLIELANKGEATPADAALLAEEAERRLERLPEDLRRVALLKLEGHTNEAIATLPEMNCTVRTIERKLRLIREMWGETDDVVSDDVR